MIHKYTGLKTRNYRDFKAFNKEINPSSLLIIDKTYLRFIDMKIIYIFSVGNLCWEFMNNRFKKAKCVSAKTNNKKDRG